MPPIIPAGSPAAAAATVAAGTIPPGMMPQNRPKHPGPQAKPQQAPAPKPQAPQQAPAPVPGNQAPPQGQQQPPQAQGQQQNPAGPGQGQPPTMGPAFAPPPKGITRHTSGPVPGQSLTSKGGHPYEKPPQYTDIDKAMPAVLNSLTEEKTCHKVLNLMEIGVPLYAIVTSFVMMGYTEGKWNPDLGLLLMEPITALLIKMAKAAKITPEIGVKEEPDDTIEQVVRHREKISAEQVDAAQEVSLTSGIVARPKKAQ